MYQNQMNSMNTVNHMNGMNGMNQTNPMHLNLLSNNNPNNNNPSFLTGIPIPNTNHLRNNNNHVNCITIGESPDSLRSTSNNSANNSTITPTDPSLFMPTIGAINSSPPLSSPNIATQSRTNHSFNNSPFRFDAPPNMGRIQSIQSQPIMQSVNAAPTQTVLFKPQFVRRSSNTSPYQVHNHRPSTPYALNNTFTPKINNTQFYNNRYTDTQQFTQQIPCTQLDHNNLSHMPLLQNDPGLDTFNVSNHLNVNPGFTMNNDIQDNNNNNNNLQLLPPNLFVNNNNMMNMLISTPTHTNTSTNIHHMHQNGPKKDILSTNNTHNNLPKLHVHPRGCEKFGFTTDKAIITDVHHINKLTLPIVKPGKRRGRPPKNNENMDSKLGIKALKNTRRRKKKDGEHTIEFIETVQWSAAHKYHQYCPFCVRDERKKHKFEFWEKLPLRETLNKHERKEYDRECKQLLQSIEDKIKKKVTFESGVEYRRHYDTFHKKYGFKCIYSGCVKESSSWYNFVAHLTQHDREMGRPFHCAYSGCNRRSSTKHNLIKHLQGVHKWKIVNKEEPKQCMKSNNNGGGVRIKCESITTASPTPNCGVNGGKNNINGRVVGVGGVGGVGGLWRGAMNNFELKMNSKDNFNEEKKKYVRSDVVQEPIIVQNNGGGGVKGVNGVNGSKVYKSDYSYYNNNSDNVPPPIMYRMCYNRMKPQPIPYPNSNLTNQRSNSMPTMNNREEKKERVSDNNCIVSPHLLTAIDKFFKDEDHENGKEMQ